MTDLKTMTLMELVEAIRMSGTLRPAIAFDELQRRQRMLDAAEQLASAASRVDDERFDRRDGPTYNSACAMRLAIAAYTAAKETP